MRFAAFETSTEWCSVALWSEGEIAGVERHAGQRHAEFILPMLDALLGRSGYAMDTLDAVAYGAGPGSFTGLRIACAVAQGIAVAHGFPVIGVSTLEAVADASGAARVLVCLDARMREVYCGAYERAGPGDAAWRVIVEPCCLPPAAVAIASVEGGWTGCGNGFFAYREELDAALGSNLCEVRDSIRASAVSVARLAAPRLLAGEGQDAADAAPIYVRDKVALTSAERRGAR